MSKSKLPVEYLCTCPMKSLQNMKLRAMDEHARLKKELADVIGEMVEAAAMAEFIEWMTQHRGFVETNALVGTDWVQAEINRRAREEEKRTAEDSDDDLLGAPATARERREALLVAKDARG